MKKNKTNKHSNDDSIEQENNSSKQGIWQDARFQHLVADPRFKTIPKAQRKVKIDKRFQGMFTDNKFKINYTVDKYGRKVNKSSAEDIKKFYELENSSDSDAEVDEQRKEEQAISRDTAESGDSSANDDEVNENDDLVSDGEEVPKSLKERLLDPDIDYARGEGRLVTDSSSDDDSTDEDEDNPELDIDEVWGEIGEEAETTEESTRRLAVCNMDWDRIRASDLMMLFSSFLPPGGSVLSIKIYPSDFGKQRMAEEDVRGPSELVGQGKEIKNKQRDGSSSEEELLQEQDSDYEEGDSYHMEKLRRYQLNRLRYYYAVAEFDSVQTADKIYQECDGLEYESSATRVDLRFIPDDTIFEEDELKDECTELPDSNYMPRQFTTTALQQAKVDLTWDETAVERRELGDKLASGKYDDINDKDLRKIVAFSSSEDEEEEYEDEDDNINENSVQKSTDGIESEKNTPTETNKKVKSKKEDSINKYKALLAEINEKEEQEKSKKYEMEFSWNIESTKKDEDEEDNSDFNADFKQLTPIEKAMLKRSEKNKKRKEERKKKKLQAQGVDTDNYNSDSDSDSIPDGIDMNDPYFAEEFANGNFVDTKSKKNKEKVKMQKIAQEEKELEEEQQAKELQLLLDDDDIEDQAKNHFSLEKILKSEQETKSKRKRRKLLKKSKSALVGERKELEDNFQINVNDDRFKAVYSSHLYNIDPTDSHFKKTKGMEQIIQEKLKRRHGNNTENGHDKEISTEIEPKRPRKQLENNLLVKSLKRKIQMKNQN